MMKVSFPHMGNYSKVVAQELGSRLGWDIIMPPPTSTRSIQRGATQLNELVCLPAKSTLGNLIEACDLGADTLLMWDNCGRCRLQAYWILQQQALRRLGYHVKVHPIRPGRNIPGDIRRVDPSISLWQAWSAFIATLRSVARSEPTQSITGPQPQIGVVGEIYTVLDEMVNHNLFAKLQKQGAFVHNSLPLSYFLFKGFYTRGWMRRKDMDYATLRKAEKMAHEVFPKDIGGHGFESIAHTCYYGLMKFDGVIHVMPFPCSPEAMVSSIVDEVAHGLNIAVMHLIFDQQAAEAGLITRLEAFTDMLKRRKS